MAGGGGVHIVAIEGESGDEFGDLPVTRVGWAEIGGLVRSLRNAGCRDIVIVGSVRRPDLAALKPDLGFFLNLPSILRIVASGGDDGVLTRVVRFFEEKGFHVLSLASVAPQLMVGEGPLGALRADARELDDIARGYAVIRALGPYDVGQAVVVSEGRFEAIEGAENTDAMLTRVSLRRRQQDGEHVRRRGVLVKRPKPRQELRIDMPAIGPATVERALDVGLRGIAVLPKGTIAAERAELIRSADAGGVFVQGVGDHGVGAPAAAVVIPLLPLGKRRPSRRQLGDAAIGAGVLAALQSYLASQGTVVVRTHVLAIESGEGIASVFARAGNLRQWGRRRLGGRSGVGVISAEAAADLRSVLSAAASARLEGVAVVGAASDTLAAAAEQADHFGLFLLAAAPPVRSP
jgi:DUF1009 family protein